MSKRRLPKSHQKQHTAPDENFIMLPTVISVLRADEKRKGTERFYCGLTERKSRNSGRNRTVVRELPREYEDEKLGILDVLVRFRNENV